jgi:hypothetical protein
MKTNRGMLKLLFLGLITFGIYPLVFYSNLSTDINIIATRYDGRKTMHFCLLFFIVAPLTLGIAAIVWSHRICARIGNELCRRGIAYRFGAGSFWGWNILGTLIFIGPFIFLHKLCKSMNLLSADYNARG